MIMSIIGTMALRKFAYLCCLRDRQDIQEDLWNIDVSTQENIAIIDVNQPNKEASNDF